MTPLLPNRGYSSGIYSLPFSLQVNETAVIRYNYGDPTLGTCKEYRPHNRHCGKFENSRTMYARVEWVHQPEQYVYHFSLSLSMYPGKWSRVRTACNFFCAVVTVLLVTQIPDSVRVPEKVKNGYFL